VESAPPPAEIPSEGSALRGVLLDLAEVWHSFRSELWRTPYFSKITRRRLQLSDYLSWMESEIPQVRQGSKWMRTAIANIRNPDWVPLKELIETHASDEQNDWKILLSDYHALGGAIQDPEAFRLNPGGSALNDFMYSRANSTNAVDLLGGIYIIEGTGQRVIPQMLPLVKQQLGLGTDGTRFLQYHGQNDENHLARWMTAVELVLSGDDREHVAASIVATARKVAELYAAQMRDVR
jgi:3-oxoacyl-[acyl-carrier-protein] synthase-3